MSLTPEQTQYYQEHADDDLRPSLIAAYAAGLALAYIFVGLRIWARKAGKPSFGLDDALILAALIPLTAFAIVGWISIGFGEGRHIIFVTNPAGFIQAYVVAIVAYAICVVLTKISILCFYCRIFFPVRHLPLVSWIFGIFIVAYNLALIFTTTLQCVPLSSMWTGAPGKCFETLPPFTALGIVNVVTDVGILALPVRHIVHLRLRVTQRVQVCGIFLLGGVVCVFGIIRVVALARAPQGDSSWNQVWSGVWSFCEVAIGIVAACLPTLAILVSKLQLQKISSSIVRLMSSTFGRSKSNSTEKSGMTTTGRRVHEVQGEGNQYAKLSEPPLEGDKTVDSKGPDYRGSSNTCHPSSLAVSTNAVKGMIMSLGLRDFLPF
ncbi:hypothetical protein BJ166DRAFT_281161 [Pestalotiopsis sp. NC0098]|nr:hypothetical protein BJ166DRAFT_281161 [Pestalotiopsis sp. NC0098]